MSKNAPYVSKVVLEPKGSETLVRIHMKRKLDKGDYKTFNLKRDSVNKRPTRSVIDVIAGPSRKTFDTKKKSSSLEKKPWRPSTQGSGYSVVGGIEGKRITLDPGTWRYGSGYPWSCDGCLRKEYYPSHFKDGESVP